MKKILSIILILTSLCACTSQKEDTLLGEPALEESGSKSVNAPDGLPNNLDE